MFFFYLYMPHGLSSDYCRRFQCALLVITYLWKLQLVLCEGYMFFCMKLRTKSFTEISKRANILLDSGFNARLSYFGLAREGPKDDRSYVTAEIHRYTKLRSSRISTNTHWFNAKTRNFLKHFGLFCSLPRQVI